MKTHILPSPTAPYTQPIDDRPHSVYEIITRQMLEDLRADLNEIKSRVNTLLWLTIGAVILDFITRLVK